VKRRLAIGLGIVAVALAAVTAGPAGAADECSGLRVCVPITGPWVVVPRGGVVFEFVCPLEGYIVAGTDVRLAAADLDVSFRAETGSPVGPGVTTQTSVVFSARRTSAGVGATSFQPFIGCIPSNGGGGRALTGAAARSAGIRPTRPLLSVVVSTELRAGTTALRAACPSGSRFLGSTNAVAFRQALPPGAGQRRAVRVEASVRHGVALARLTVGAAAGPGAEFQLRAICARKR
jgi:hypothetical protein